jgi:hypothetical protein
VPPPSSSQLRDLEAPKLTGRGLLRAAAGICLLTVLGAIATWFSMGAGHSSAPVYGNGGSAAARTWTWDGKDFTAEPMTQPGPNSNDAEMAFDTGSRVLVLWDHGCSRLVMGFTGGCQSQVDQTWTWDGRAWTRRHARQAPAAIGQGAMLYDGQLGQVVYVNRVGQAWGWSGSAWQSIAKAGAPRLTAPGSQADPALSLVAVGYDESRNLLVLALASTTWTWDGQQWRQISGGIAGGDGQSDPRAVYDVGRRELVYLGSRFVWTWDGSRWQSHEQPNLNGGTAGYDPLRDTLIVVRQDATACDGTACMMRVWTWDGATWSAQAVTHPAVLPLTRSGVFNPPMTFDEALGVMVLFASAS